MKTGITKRIRRTYSVMVGIALSILTVLCPRETLAAEVFVIPLEMCGEDVISVDLPAVSEDGESPFDFIIDPQGLIYETDAARYGGGKVEEGATLLFHNHDGEYIFSKQSDRLSVRNQSNVPVVVTITAGVSDLGDIEILGSPDFEESDACSMYLAIVDDEGNERPVSEDGEVSVSIEMRKAPDNAYVYRIDEETGDYSYELTTSPEEIDFDSYSFGLVGYCNPNGNWQEISVHPRVTVTWKVEPVLSEDTNGDTTMEDAVADENTGTADQYTDTENTESMDEEAQMETKADGQNDETVTADEGDREADNGEETDEQAVNDSDNTESSDGTGTTENEKDEHNDSNKDDIRTGTAETDETDGDMTQDVTDNG